MKTIGLGIDIGGTATRWALSDPSGRIIACGQGPALHGILLDESERHHAREALLRILNEARSHACIDRIFAGITGYGPGTDTVFQSTLEQFAGKQASLVMSDILLSYLCAFEPGQGYLVYAGTGSMSAYVDEGFRLHRVGGRGAIIDDGGGGFWVAKEAFRRIWQQMDTNPDFHLQSTLAQSLFKAIGGHDWAFTRQFMYTQKRGDIGKLAVHVARTVESDPMSRLLVQDAGRELARLANTQIHLHGARPVRVAGGAAHLHPLYFETFIQCLNEQVEVQLIQQQPQFDAARLAATSSVDYLDRIRSAIQS